MAKQTKLVRISKIWPKLKPWKKVAKKRTRNRPRWCAALTLNVGWMKIMILRMFVCGGNM